MTLPTWCVNLTGEQRLVAKPDHEAPNATHLRLHRVARRMDLRWEPNRPGQLLLVFAVFASYPLIFVYSAIVAFWQLVVAVSGWFASAIGLDVPRSMETTSSLEESV